MKISASIFATKNRNMSELVSEIQESTADLIHFDFPMNTAPDFELLTELRQKTRLPFDGHLIHPNPVEFLKPLEDLGFDQVAIQAETMPQELLSEKYSDKYTMKIGLAIQAKEGYRQYLDKLSFFDYALVMTTVPGVSGMKFDHLGFDMIEAIRATHPGLPIEVDGGVNEEISQRLENLKIDVAVSGSALINSRPMKSELAKLVGKSELNFIKKILIPSGRSPKVLLDADFEKILRTVDFYKLGGTLVTDDSDRLLGVITNGNIRNAITKYRENIFKLQAKDFYNKNPTSIYVDMSQQEVLEIVTAVEHDYSLIPVVDRSNVIVGSSSSARVIRGR